MIFDLAEDFAAALEAMPRKHRKRRTLRLLNEAIRRDIHFIDRHPTTLFQCMWNSCWWYDNPKTVYHYVEPKAGKAPRTPSCGFWQRKLYKRMKTWRKQKEKATRDFLWVESLRPPRAPLGGGQIRVLAGHSNSVTVLAYSPCGGHLVSASADGSAAVWDVRSGALTSRFPGHGERITALAVSPDGRMAVTGVEGQAIRLWRCEDGAELPRLDDHSYNGGGVAWSRDGRYLACSADDNTIRLWNASDGRPLSPIPCGDGAAEHLAFSPDSRFLAFCQKGGDTVVQDVQDISRRHVMSTHERRVNCLAWGPHSLRLVISADDRTCIWDMRTGQSTLTLPDYSNVVSDLCFSPDGERLATAAWDETVRLWDTETGRQIACFEGHDDRVFAVAFSPDGTRLASGGVDNTVRIWDTEKPRGSPHLIGKPDVIGMSFSELNETFVAGCEDGTVWVWDTDTALLTRRLRLHDAPIYGVALSADGSLLATGSHDGTICLVNMQTGTRMATFEGHTKAVFDVAFGRRGQWLASSSWDGMVRVWETATGKTRLTLAGHIDSVYGVAFSPDDKRVAAASEDKVVFVWDTRTSLPILGLRHEVSVRDVAFSSDNTRIATVTWDAGSRVWDAETGECLEQLDERYEVEGLAGGKAAQFRVALGHRETTIRRASSGEEAGWFPGSLTELAAHPCRWMWAGYLGKNFVLFTLNGVLPDERPT